MRRGGAVVRFTKQRKSPQVLDGLFKYAIRWSVINTKIR